mgnify:CR=1 FL=1
MARPIPSDDQLISLLDCPTESETSGNFIRLEREYGVDALVPSFERIFPQIRRYGGRMNILFRLVSYSRDRPTVVALALNALKDRSRIVRYHACAALAYALKSNSIPALEGLLTHPDDETRGHAEAAIDAIRSGNHHFFADRKHTGKSFWHPGHYSVGDR